MEYRRADRVADQVQRILAELFYRRVRDPRLHRITVTGVDMTSDLRYAKIYYCSMGKPDDRADIDLALSKATGFIRAELGKRIRLKYLPSLSFHYDESFDYGEKIDRLLSRLQGHEEDNAERHG